MGVSLLRGGFRSISRRVRGIRSRGVRQYDLLGDRMVLAYQGQSMLPCVCFFGLGMFCGIGRWAIRVGFFVCLRAMYY